MRLARAVCRAAPRDRVPKRAAIAAFVLAVLVALPGSSSAGQKAQVNVLLWPAGRGKIEATLENGGAPLTTCNSDDVVEIGTGTDACSPQVDLGTRVKLVATGFDADTPFLYWSRFDCEGTGPCTVTADESGDLIVATFKQQRLEVLLEGTGKVTSTDGSISCPPRCQAILDAGTEVELEAEGAHTWGKGCEPENGDPASRRCSLTMSNLRTFATIGFGVDPPDLPFDVRVNLRIQRRGSGDGRVTAQGKDADGNDWRIDCGSACVAKNLQFQSRVTLRAEAGSGARFVRWAGVCSTNPVCRFSAGSQTLVGAVFEASAPPPPPPPPPPPSPSRPFRPTLTTVKATGSGSNRAVVLRVTVDRISKTTIRLLRGRSTLATHAYELARGTTLVRFPLPRRVKAGWYRITLNFVGPRGETAALSRPLHIRR